MRERGTKVAHSLSTGALAKNVLERIVMPNLENDFRKLTTDARQMAEENARLRKVNSQMISALEYVLPLLQQGLPATVDFDWTKEAVAKVQDALAEAERD
jgi:hypothetical protein